MDVVARQRRKQCPAVTSLHWHQNLACSAGRMEEEESAIEGLMLLWRRLHAEMQRMRATPATRLLDDVLRAMNPASELDLADRQEVYCHWLYSPSW